MIEKAEFLEASRLRVELTDDGRWKLEAPLVFRSKVLDRTVYVPMGFSTDFSSVPRLPVIYMLLANRCFKAAALHDALLENGASREEAAAVFLEAMEVEGIPEIYRHMMYAGVRLNDDSYLTSTFPKAGE